MENIVELLQKVVTFIQNSGSIGVLISCAMMTVESILPFLPLGVFITITMLVVGKFWGFIISWIFTIIGCSISFFIFRNGFGNKFDHLTENKELIKKYKKVFKDISLGKLVLIIAMPFTPAFVVNIVAGLCKMDFKKYLIAIIIGKISMVYFWGYIGTSLVESITNPLIIIKIVVSMILCYLIYILVKMVFKLDL
jgi:uncharacterized membrane protein YdjX (TVP38/TMEM64 family)